VCLHAVVPAAGFGARFGAALPKQYQRLAGTPVIVHSVRVLLDLDPVEKVWVIVAPGDREATLALASLLQAWPQRLAICAIGGATRRDTVLAGLAQVREEGAHWVLVHDAARPLLRPSDALALIENCLRRGHGGILARPVVDTVKRVAQPVAPEAGQATHFRDAARCGPETDADEVHSPAASACKSNSAARRVTPEGALVETIARDRLWLAQTPQMFEVALLSRALAQHPDVTDECAAIERIGAPVLLLEGSQDNVKLTSPGDLALLESQLSASDTRFPTADVRASSIASGSRPELGEPLLRIGQGYDVHALVPGRRLIIGGVAIDYPRGLLGHSDADVLLHAVTDAILGAAGLGDIGTHFPDHDPQFRNADSQRLLRETVMMVRSRGWQIENLDCSVIAQAPRLAPYRAAIVERVAACLGVLQDRVNLKAKTQEWLGFEGRGEGISAQAVVLLKRAAG
jgi:2-C-methyl-D-erythritol 4-phosphate cytidylyltransferase/2-C-methyl-D-erythritol 2,4-cyclodiphosphate synthase